MGRLLGIDYGQKRIGLALSDPSKTLASSLETIIAGKNPAETAKKISLIIEKQGDVEAIVIGLPLHLSGKDSPMSLEVKELAQILESLTGLRVILWDERLTTTQVERALKEQAYNRKKRAKMVDALAAVLILQSYLDSL